MEEIFEENRRAFSKKTMRTTKWWWESYKAKLLPLKIGGSKPPPYVEDNGGCTKCLPTGLRRQPIVCTDFALLIHRRGRSPFPAGEGLG